ncbi:hypothetical protein HUO13_02925 [Saccharopolyspora erythraea]|uniref:hypothetical protein n=1 Tax=Saccharopolyspora erythraea TaxID=1836 RepID=UPI001BABB802|nr:hypothetical protein [Saccharopolyspora erythraea]QUG99895.1 hypothetical protein HUO13_02925 [Saccharopolyspora erythraea]
MTPEDRALVVVLRQAQWLLDDAAHDIPGDRYSPQQSEELANTLDKLAEHVRHRAGLPLIINAEH